MQTLHPERALNYRNLAYVAGNIDLTSSASVPQFNFEVNGKFTANKDDIDPVITEGFNFSTNSGTLTVVSGDLEYAQYYKSDKSCQLVYYTANGEEKTVENFTRYSRNGSKYSFNLNGYGAISAHIYLTYNSTIRLDANPKDIILTFSQILFMERVFLKKQLKTCKIFLIFALLQMFFFLLSMIHRMNVRKFCQILQKLQIQLLCGRKEN